MIVIERLRALEKEWRDAANQHVRDYAGCTPAAVVETLRDCADELAILIAELGQEVGAVAPVSFAVELADGTLGALGWIDYAKFEHVKNMGTLANGARYVFAYRTSTSHTSEARDAAMTGPGDHDDLPAFLEWVAGEVVRRDTRAGNFAEGLAQSLRGRAHILRIVKNDAMQAKEAK